MNPLNVKTIDISGLHLIEASAGTGKTWTIEALYILLLLEKELNPEQILVVTYTKAATSELRDRIRRRISRTLELFNGERTETVDELEQILMVDRPQNPERARLLLKRALFSFDDAAIFTIHGFCQRALLENAFECGSLFDSEMISDQSAIVRQACDDFWRTNILGQPEDFLQYLVAENFTPEKLAKPFDGHYQNPDLKVIPVTDRTDLKPCISRRDTLYTRFCQLWSSDRTAIIVQLEGAKLNRNSYKPEQIAAASTIIDAWVAGGDPNAPCGRLEFFSAAKISTRITKTTSSIPDHPFFILCQQMFDAVCQIEQSRQEMLIHCRQDLKKWLERELSLRKKALNQRCFDDLLLDLHLALESTSGVVLASRLRERYQAALIDEFQDTDPLQWSIFKRLGAADGYPLFLIGDPKQAIYSFRGADVYAYLNAGKSVGAEKRQTLGTNFRSVPALVKAVNTLFLAHPDPFLSADIPFNPVSSGRTPGDILLCNGSPPLQPLHLWVYPRDDESVAETKPVATGKTVRAVAAEIARLLEQGRYQIAVSGLLRPLTPRDIAVLVKTHKQASRVQQALQSISIPSVQHGSATIFESGEALDLLRILRAAAEPGRGRLVREALLTSSIGLTANEVAAFLEYSGEHQEWEEWLLRFRDLGMAAHSGGIIALSARLLGNCGLRGKLLSRVGGERSLTNILHCVELLHQAELEHGRNLAWSISWLERRISGNQKDDDALLRLETDDNAVRISTIHASKGLEYPVVFIPFAWDPPSDNSWRVIYHDSDGRLVLDLAAEDGHKQLAREERDAEAARLLYVAMTRAEFRCYVVWGCIKGAVDSPLYDLLHGSRVSNTFASLSDQAILDDIRTLSGSGESGIVAEMMPPGVDFAGYHDDTKCNEPYICRTLAHQPADNWRVSSFSGMISVAGHIFQPRDHDNLPTEAATDNTSGPVPSSGGLTIFEFPRGAKAGTCLHEIFEQLDFAALRNDHITTITRTKLAANGFSDLWHPTVCRMVSDTAKARIIRDDPDFSLSQLKAGAWQTEMEFYLPVGQFAPDTLRSLFRGVLDDELFGDFHEVLKSLLFQRSRGMLQGFIDMVFVHAGRYYLLDWKSNHLGNSLIDYGPGPMHEAMCRSAYILQYHLYTLALDRLLKLRLPGYDYEFHFGGAIYLFLRGVTSMGTGSGIYHARPSLAFIRRADEIMLTPGQEYASREKWAQHDFKPRGELI